MAQTLHSHIDSVPITSQEVLHWLEAGRLPPSDALKHLQRLDEKKSNSKVSVAEEDSRDHDAVADVLRDLDALIGLHDIKRMVSELRAYVEIQHQRSQMQLAADNHMMHMIFRGSPGTGKTTIARILGQLFRALDILPKGHLVEVERADLVGEYIGHTAQKTREVIKRALGGVMFVDEAYSLARGGEKDFGKEAIDTLVKAMEDHRDEFLLILAGYPDEMSFFLATNPGLMSRFPLHFDFPNYKSQELMAIARVMLIERQYHLSSDAERELGLYLDERDGFWHKNAGNARMIRNLMERAIRKQAVRLMAHPDRLSREQLMTLTWSDFEGGL